MESFHLLDGWIAVEGMGRSVCLLRRHTDACGKVKFTTTFCVPKSRWDDFLKWVKGVKA